MFRSNNNVGLAFIVLLVFCPVMVAGAEESACAQIQAGNSDSSGETQSGYFDQQFAVAEQLRQGAATAGAEWLKTEELLMNSREHAANGQWSKALQLVQKACFQAELALQQVEYESEAWKHRVIE